MVRAVFIVVIDSELARFDASRDGTGTGTAMAARDRRPCRKRGMSSEANVQHDYALTEAMPLHPRHVAQPLLTQPMVARLYFRYERFVSTWFRCFPIQTTSSQHRCPASL